MKKIRVAIVPMPVAGPQRVRRETVWRALGRDWRRLSRPRYGFYSET